MDNVQLLVLVETLRKENARLRDALAPFACLGRNELTPGDFNRARRAMRGEAEGSRLLLQD